MKPIERQAKILTILRNEGRIQVSSLVDQLGTSPETIRRDLTELAVAGKLQKVHGGAILPQILGEGPFQQRMGENMAAKRIIAEKACSLITPGDSLFIDTGTTTLTFAEELVSVKNLLVVTNSSDIAKILGAQSSNQVFLVGGEYNAENHETVGPMAISQLQQFRLKHAILTIGAIDANGVMDFDMNEALIAKTMIKQASNVIVLADTSKHNHSAPFSVAMLSEINQFICDTKPDQQLKEAIKQAGTRLYFH